MISVWKKLTEEKFKVGFRAIVKKKFQLPNDKVVDFDIKLESQAVCILALTEDNKVILTKQFRPGPEKVLLELPGGGVDLGELPDESIKREFLEETGYSGNLKFVGTSLNCAYSTKVTYNYTATNCRKVSSQNLDSNEFIEVLEISLEDFRKHLRSGELTDVATGYLGLDSLGLL
jgi:ADP-ribose pyrophosphatase